MRQNHSHCCKSCQCARATCSLRWPAQWLSHRSLSICCWQGGATPASNFHLSRTWRLLRSLWMRFRLRSGPALSRCCSPVGAPLKCDSRHLSACAYESTVSTNQRCFGTSFRSGWQLTSRWSCTRGCQCWAPQAWSSKNLALRGCR